jgi:hypothetical protein
MPESDDMGGDTTDEMPFQELNDRWGAELFAPKHPPEPYDSSSSEEMPRRVVKVNTPAVVVKAKPEVETGIGTQTEPVRVSKIKPYTIRRKGDPMSNLEDAKKDWSRKMGELFSPSCGCLFYNQQPLHHCRKRNRNMLGEVEALEHNWNESREFQGYTKQRKLRAINVAAQVSDAYFRKAKNNILDLEVKVRLKELRLKELTKRLDKEAPEGLG